MRINKRIVLPVIMGTFLICTTGCDNEESKELGYILKKEDVNVKCPDGEFNAVVNQALKVEVESVSDEDVNYAWFLGDKEISNTKSLEYTFESTGTYKLKLQVSQGDVVFEYEYFVNVDFGEISPLPQDATPYITKVFDYCPAPGQFVNTMPEYNDGDTQETMNDKVLEAIGNNAKGLITLGGFGGYVTVGFDHTIENKPDVPDFRVLGNAFSNSSEPGIVMVAYDLNKNGLPDDNEWYEIAGSAHKGDKEEWFADAEKAGNDIAFYKDYEMTYYRPESEEVKKEYIKWESNKGKVKSGYKEKNQFHTQTYYPQWISDDKLIFKGSCLPQNGYDTSGEGTYFVTKEFKYGYVDVYPNDDDKTNIDIAWAVDKDGKSVDLPGVDFIKIYTGVNQENGWIGECSTEVTGIEDLHLLEK